MSRRGFRTSLNAMRYLPQICPRNGGAGNTRVFLHSFSKFYLFHSGPHRIRVSSHNGIDHHCNLERTCHRFYKDSQSTVSVELKRKQFARCLSEFDRKTPKCLKILFDIQRIFLNETLINCKVLKEDYSLLSSLPYQLLGSLRTWSIVEKDENNSCTTAIYIMIVFPSWMMSSVYFLHIEAFQRKFD